MKYSVEMLERLVGTLPYPREEGVVQEAFVPRLHIAEDGTPPDRILFHSIVDEESDDEDVFMWALEIINPKP